MISSEVALSPTIVAITSWTVSDDDDRPLALVVPGASRFDRQQVLRPYVEGEWRRFQSGIVIDTSKPTGWLEGQVATDFLARIQRMPMPELPKEVMARWYKPEPFWGLLWALTAVEEFVVNEAFRQILDKPFYLVHDVHKALWEARFLSREHDRLGPVEAFMTHFTRWISGEPLGDAGQRALADLGIRRLVTSASERLDVLNFLLSLACQNGLLERAIFLFDDLEQALQPNKRAVLRQFRDLLQCGHRWAQLGGSPLGILIGFTGSRSDFQLLEQLHAPLAADVREGLRWAHQSLSS